ncbi:MAG: asparagine synthase (glutamine-hydrolyzing) [Gammaproteobacteria bacterium]|nr:asparagine synthase (glutamine-hydrolyzing) [Gammaproteobacteria bacterium]
MCGITGFWRRAGTKVGDCARLARMADLISHRGPDDYGYLYASTSEDRVQITQQSYADFTPDVLLANRRLAITDLSTAARQPIGNDTNDVFVVFNGAIHNFVELRDELTRLGYRFRTRSDPEVLLHAYEQWGEDCACRFNGMWAYVIWDHRRRRLVCSRDRFGIKPLYIAEIGDAFFFASEAKSILASQEVPREPNLTYIKHVLSLGVPREGTNCAFAHIRQLPAGHNLVISKKATVHTAYWQYNDQSEPYDYNRPEETFRELLSDAVRIRLRGDVRAALLLSGGLDSSSVAVLAARHAPGQLEAFTARFPGYADDESLYAAAAAQHADMPITFVDYDASNFLNHILTVSWHMDVPIALGQMVARWSLIGQASRNATVLLEGQGADEALGGYPTRYTRPYLKSELGQLRWSVLPWTLVRSLHTLTNPQSRRALRHIFKHTVIGTRRRTASNSPTAGLLTQRMAALSDYDSGFPRPHSPHFADRLTHILWLDHTSNMLPYLLHFGDAISMGRSMESRLPFLDHRLVEFMFALPFHYKMRGGKSKVILRRALKHDLPREVLARRRKVGFSTPIDQWLRPILYSEIKPLLQSSRLRQRDLLVPESVTRLLNGFEKHGHGAPQILRCVATELWFRQFIDADGFIDRGDRRTGG